MATQTNTILVIAEHDNERLSADTLATLSAAREIQQHAADPQEALICVLIIGFQCQNVVDILRGVEGISEVMVADSPDYEHQLSENVSATIAQICQQENRRCSHILAAATTFGKDILPRTAALLDVGQLSDVISIESTNTVVRPIYAGNALARVRSLDPIKIITVRSSAFDAMSTSSDSECIVTTVNLALPCSHSEFVSEQKVMSERPDLTAARVVVSGGRGLGDKASFGLVEQLADKLGGAIGASRAAVDAGFVSNDLQVGQTGKIVAPELYIAVGISGAIQHLAGMKDSKVIVAINSDPDAAIFQIADYGIVGDLFDIMPELISSV
jgi:electron transfer flavoprotein alpha subunit